MQKVQNIFQKILKWPHPQIERHLDPRATEQLFPTTQHENYGDLPISKRGDLIGEDLLHTPIWVKMNTGMSMSPWSMGVHVHGTQKLGLNPYIHRLLLWYGHPSTIWTQIISRNSTWNLSRGKGHFKLIVVSSFIQGPWSSSLFWKSQKISEAGNCGSVSWYELRTKFGTWRRDILK